MGSETLPMFRAVRPEEPEIEVDATDFEDEPTVPRNDAPERKTDRPSAGELNHLREASRGASGWLDEPRWSYDVTTGELVLTAPYTAQQSDQHGNRFVVACMQGLAVAPPQHLRMLRTLLVAEALRRQREATVFPFDGTGHLLIAVNDRWRGVIVTAFSEGDMGLRERG